MKQSKSVLPEIFGLNEIEKKIYYTILDKWPTTSMEIAINLGENTLNREFQKRASAKYSYYLKKLVEKKLIVMKKSGNTLIVWPLLVEKYRTIHDILKQQEPEHLMAIVESALKEENNYA
ncbi:MAG: hypothetical protein PHO61_02625 [Candidatus ainarchaeum sp.]|jgi:hypothetical protein|nr:hypothetical protein [Candidatus ainarchaeum sp.]MDD3086160.1 hypothetical protein [Candidatus ainarchaeum sp.]MDD4467724.1 hypothetical protein [Candidatus ainarchaeum sp.]HPM85768.1 hypothetical protein [archaeon]